MISTTIARISMISSLGYYTLTLAAALIGSLLGYPHYLWEFLDLPHSSQPPLSIALIAGIILSVFTVYSLSFSYWSIEKILHGGYLQNFTTISVLIRNTSIGLIGFWLGYNLLSIFLPILVTMHLPDINKRHLEWDPLDIDIVLLILAIALHAISQALKRAGEIEQENNHFL